MTVTNPEVICSESHNPLIYNIDLPTETQDMKVSHSIYDDANEEPDANTNTIVKRRRNRGCRAGQQVRRRRDAKLSKTLGGTQVTHLLDNEIPRISKISHFDATPPPGFGLPLVSFANVSETTHSPADWTVGADGNYSTMRDTFTSSYSAGSPPIFAAMPPAVPLYPGHFSPHESLDTLQNPMSYDQMSAYHHPHIQNQMLIPQGDHMSLAYSMYDYHHHSAATVHHIHTSIPPRQEVHNNEISHESLYGRRTIAGGEFDYGMNIPLNYNRYTHEIHSVSQFPLPSPLNHQVGHFDNSRSQSAAYFSYPNTPAVMVATPPVNAQGGLLGELNLVTTNMNKNSSSPQSTVAGGVAPLPPSRNHTSNFVTNRTSSSVYHHQQANFGSNVDMLLLPPPPPPPSSSQLQPSILMTGSSPFQLPQGMPISFATPPQRPSDESHLLHTINHVSPLDIGTVDFHSNPAQTVNGVPLSSTISASSSSVKSHFRTSMPSSSMSSAGQPQQQPCVGGNIQATSSVININSNNNLHHHQHHHHLSNAAEFGCAFNHGVFLNVPIPIDYHQQDLYPPSGSMIDNMNCPTNSATTGYSPTDCNNPNTDFKFLVEETPINAKNQNISSSFYPQYLPQQNGTNAVSISSNYKPTSRGEMKLPSDMSTYSQGASADVTPTSAGVGAGYTF